jgi:hypothetical protein
MLVIVAAMAVEGHVARAGFEVRWLDARRVSLWHAFHVCDHVFPARDATVAADLDVRVVRARHTTPLAGDSPIVTTLL